VKVCHSIAEAVELLEAGGVVIYPTETAYALGADATNQAAVDWIFQIKGRGAGKGLPVVIPSMADPSAYVQVGGRYQALTADHWPGPLNIIAPRLSDSVIVALCATGPTQSLRKTSSPLAAALVDQFKRPLTATSANRAGEPTVYDAAELVRLFKDEPLVAGLLDAGALPPLPPSTTVEVTLEGELLIHRQGGLIL
jgi:L-threonylcarbamoyladenylate synthase